MKPWVFFLICSLKCLFKVKQMKTFSLKIVPVMLFSLLTITPLWAGNTKTISVSCVIEPRITVHLNQNPVVPNKTDLQMANSSSQNSKSLLRQIEFKKTGLPFPYESAIIYTYCAR
jgi:hypothetical protein